MWECYSNNIHLLFLPPHTSHVLQPLDLSVFSPLKHAYRKRLGALALFNDSTPIGKQNFLNCYKLARIDALTVINCKAGWKASGLWPVRISKPLMNRLLLENSNKAVEQTPRTSKKDQVPEWNQDSSFIVFKTPQKSEDIRDQARQITGLGTADPTTARVLFRKVAKSLDNKDYVIAQHELRIKQLEVRVLQLESRKRRKVVTSPNSKFVDIEAIYKAQIEAGDRQNVPLDSDSVVSIASTLSHITIKE
jgi:4-hydroxybenzoate polyprenyltransferase